MEQSPTWEANSSSSSQEIPQILWNPEVYYRNLQEPSTCLYPKQAFPKKVMRLLLFEFTGDGSDN